MHRILLLFPSLCALAACSSSGSPHHAAAPTCAPASLNTLADIGDALTTPKGRGLFDGYIVKLSEPIDGYRYLIAAKVNVGSQPVGVWAVGDGTVDSLNATALKYTQWGRAGAPDSRATLANSREYAAAVGCAQYSS